MMTEEKWSDVIVAVWLAGCEYFRQRLIILPHSQTERQPGDRASKPSYLSFYRELKKIIKALLLDLSRTVPVQWSSSAKLIALSS